jgi:hypothetical protein
MGLLLAHPIYAQRSPCANVAPTISNLTATSAQVNVPISRSGFISITTTNLTYAYGGTSYVLPFNAATAQITGLPPATLVTVAWTGSCQGVVSGGNFVTTRTVTFTTASPLATRAAGSSGVSVHPNPTTDRFTLTLATPLPSAGTLVLTDVVGRPVRQQALAVGTRTLVVEVAGLMPGVYVLRCGSAASSVVVE